LIRLLEGLNKELLEHESPHEFFVFYVMAEDPRSVTAAFNQHLLQIHRSLRTDTTSLFAVFERTRTIGMRSSDCSSACQMAVEQPQTSNGGHVLKSGTTHIHSTGFEPLNDSQGCIYLNFRNVGLARYLTRMLVTR
jgi:hypothetical protein